MSLIFSLVNVRSLKFSIYTLKGEKWWKLLVGTDYSRDGKGGK